jgi:DNA-binding MarR family transcriptional regulator
MTQRTISKKTFEDRLQSIGYKIKILSQLSQRRLQLMLAPYDLTPFHWLVLRCLWIENGLPISDISQRLQEAGGTMTGVLDRMEERSLIVRVKDPSDRRVWRVFLTKKGQELESELMPVLQYNRKHFTKGIAPKDLQTFERVMDTLMTNCRAMLEAEFDS